MAARRKWPTCINGHTWDAANTYTGPSGYDACRRCASDRQKKRRADAKNTVLVERAA